jgi:hypothetical protein
MNASEAKAIMCIELDELIELAKAMGTTDAKIVNRIIDAQDNTLQRQRVKAECSRMKEELAVSAPRTVGWMEDAAVIWGRVPSSSANRLEADCGSPAGVAVVGNKSGNVKNMSSIDHYKKPSCMRTAGTRSEDLSPAPFESWQGSFTC